MSGKALFVFAHQDDEISYIIRMRNLVREGCEVHVAWMTDGAYFVPFEVRQSESLRAMKMMGVREENLHFLKFPDGRSIRFANRIVEKLALLIEDIKPDEIYTIAYEGGHPDHDFAHVAAVVSSRRVAKCKTPVLYEAPLYNSYRSLIPVYSRFVPAPSPVLMTPTRMSDVFFKLKVVCSYRSQFWIAILPIFLLDPVRTMARGEPFRKIPDWNYLQPPHEGKLGYERLFVWRLLHIKFSDFRDAVAQVL
ncbi:MAG: PIG-L family deacetylase [Actinomycetota bacterium]|nr:PIG-L family deacetylase [Actinomycetota bacterium]